MKQQLTERLQTLTQAEMQLRQRVEQATADLLKVQGGIAEIRHLLSVLERDEGEPEAAE